MISAQRQDAALVAVDDAHWSDTASLRFLIGLSERLSDLPAVVMVAARPSISGPRGELIARLTAVRRARILTLKPLGLAAVSASVEQGGDGRTEPAFVQACAHATGGNPFLLEELLGHIRAQGIEASAAAAQRVAEALAILGDQTPLRRVALLAGVEPDAADAAADALARAAITRTGEPLEFLHPLIAAAVLADIPEFGRRRARRRAVALLAADRAPVEQVCSQLLDARTGADPWVVASLRDAGRAALELIEEPQAPGGSGRSIEAVRPLAELVLADDASVDGLWHGIVFRQVAGALITTDDLDALEAAAVAAFDAAQHRGSAVGVGISMCWKSVADHLCGRLLDAVVGGEAAMELARLASR